MVTDDTQKALKLHIWPPSTLDEETLLVFATHFHDKPSLMKAQDGKPLVAPYLMHIGQSVSITDHRQVAMQLQQVEEHIIEYVQACLSKFGLLAWRPDPRQIPYTLYNAACCIIALNMFKQALVSHTYAHLALNVTYAKDMVFLIKLYDHFIHYYLLSCYKKEC
jgi:hypothetical protein